jgi:two-component system chemotaxis response regulator CheB
MGRPLPPRLTILKSTAMNPQREAGQIGHDIVVVGTSVGGVEALTSLVSLLPGDLRASLFIVLHTMPRRESLLPDILQRVAALPVAPATDGEPIRPGRVYVAPPDLHLVLRADQMRLLLGPKANGHRPAVDPLFRSAADAFGPRVVGVVLTGGRDCGAGGLVDIKRRGGIAVVQDPATAVGPEMPRNALATGVVDFCLPVEEIAPLIVRLSRAPAAAAAAAEVAAGSHSGNGQPPLSDSSQSMTLSDLRDWKNGAHTDVSCPDCGGVLREIAGAGDLMRFRCRIGHALSMETLQEEKADALETALSSALRVLSESAELSRRIAARAADRPSMRRHFEEQARDADTQADLIRSILVERGDPARLQTALATTALTLPTDARQRLAQDLLDSLPQKRKA